MSDASKELAKLIGAGLVSLVLLVFGLIILLHNGSDADLEKAATGWIGLVAGYWLK
ncbi:MAG TPA: hypothetical protein VHT25_01105 [Solirubrobacteraceae bacterium]|jgi:hypothetical protein|nr:hypothetical protein [Solirubrobacteraceae bacterium]